MAITTFTLKFAFQGKCVPFGFSFSDNFRTFYMLRIEHKQRLNSHENDVITIRVATGPGKPWNFVLKNSRPWKVLENALGPGKSWNSGLQVQVFLTQIVI